MASLRDRAEALLEDVGLEGSGKLADDVRRRGLGIHRDRAFAHRRARIDLFAKRCEP